MRNPPVLIIITDVIFRKAVDARHDGVVLMDTITTTIILRQVAAVGADADCGKEAGGRATSFSCRTNRISIMPLGIPRSWKRSGAPWGGS